MALGQTPAIYMQDTTASYGLSVHSARQIQAEYVNSSSVLVGKQIDTITVQLKKVGLPIGSAQVGTFNSDLSVKKLFGTIDSSTLTTSYKDYTFSLPAGQTYQILSGDRIGVKYTGGENSTNHIAIMTDQNGTEPFDGMNSYLTYYAACIVCNHTHSKWWSFPTKDLYMTLEMTNSVPTSSVPPNKTDKFGIKEIYATIPGGQEWFSKWDNGMPRIFGYSKDPKDSWFDAAHGDATYRIDGNGLFKVSGNTPRMYIHDPTLTHSWGNVEMTTYVMRISDTNIPWGGIEGVARTNHGTTGPELRDLCDTRGIDAKMRFDGHIDFEKETSHPNWVAIANRPTWSGGLPHNTWIGYKFVVYDLPDGNVKLEQWLDMTDGLNGGNWTKVNEIVDSGKNFGVGGVSCKSGINPASKLTIGDNRVGSESGKPNISVYWRSDGIGSDGLVYKKMSVREINAES